MSFAYVCVLSFSFLFYSSTRCLWAYVCSASVHAYWVVSVLVLLISEHQKGSDLDCYFHVCLTISVRLGSFDGVAQSGTFPAACSYSVAT